MMRELSFVDYCKENGIVFIEGDSDESRFQDYLLKVNLEVYMLVRAGLVPCLNLVEITTVSGFKGLLPAIIYDSEDTYYGGNDVRKYIYRGCNIGDDRIGDIEVNILWDYSVTLPDRLDILESYLEHMFMELKEEEYYNFNGKGYSSEYTKFKKMSYYGVYKESEGKLYIIEGVDKESRSLVCRGIVLRGNQVIRDEGTVTYGLDDNSLDGCRVTRLVKSNKV